MKPKILFADKIHDSAIKLAEEFADVTCDFEITPEELIEKIPEYDAVVVRSRSKIRKDAIDAGKKLKAIGRAGVGLDNIDVDYAKQKGIAVVNAPTSLTVSVAELTLGLMFCLARHLHHADRTMRAGEWNKKKYMGVELQGKTMGVIGFGRIGRELAIKACALGMKVMAYDPYLTLEEFKEYNTQQVELDQLLKAADFISVHVPATPENKNFINADRLALMKPTAYIVNTSRGTVMDEDALTQALKAGKIAGAGLDVYQEEPLPEDSELKNLENVVLTPHIGAGTEDAQIVAGTIVVDEIKKILG
ncbi:MAG: hydroxyacid dehydrogenase [Candidatus Altiarchaeota archaeon]